MKDVHRHVQLPVCQPDADEHCLTCADEVVLVRVLRIDPVSRVALVEGSNQVEEIDMMLVEDAVPGDLLLVHGGVAIARQEKGV